MSKNIFKSYKENQNINLDEITLTDNDYKNVSYNHNNTYKTPLSKPKKSQNFNFKIFVTLISISAIFIFGVVFYLSYNLFSPEIFKNISNDNVILTKENLEENPSNISEILLDKEIIKLTGVIQSIDYENKILEIIDLNSNYNYNLNFIGNTSLKDKYEKTLTIKEFTLGDIVDFSFNEKDELIYLNKNSNVTEYKYIQNVIIDIENKLIKFENKSLKYNSYIKITKNSEEYPLNDINSLDYLNIKVYNDTVYAIEIEKGHGNLIFINKDNLLNATIEIDTNIFKSLSDVSEISLSEGYHKIVIKESSINTFIKEIYISSSQDLILDLSEVQVKSGVLLINTNVSNYNLYVNNEVKSNLEPLELTYGAYKIKIEKDGYTPFETEVIINTPQKYLNVTLESLEYAGKITINSNPESAEVYVDNIFVGYTPLTYKTSYGNHTVLLKKSGYEDFNLQNVYVSDTEIPLNVVMRISETSKEVSDEEVFDENT